MAKEIEAKFKLDGSEVLGCVAAIIGLGGTLKGVARETNIFFDKRGRLDQRDECLRVRVEIDPSRGHGSDKRETWRVTFKGKKESGRLKVRDEHETTVTNGSGMISILTAIGFKEGFRFQKYRAKFGLGKCTIEIDELPEIGMFCEIEGPDKESVQKMLKKLGYARRKLITSGYGTLLRNRLKKASKKSKNVAFPPGHIHHDFHSYALTVRN